MPRPFLAILMSTLTPTEIGLGGNRVDHDAAGIGQRVGRCRRPTGGGGAGGRAGIGQRRADHQTVLCAGDVGPTLGGVAVAAGA